VVGPGDQIEGWRLERPLGVGGAGRVWLATGVRAPGERVAIKLVPAAVVPGLADRFRHEAECLKGFKHPHIVGFRAFGELRAQRLRYLVMELVEGEDLAAVIARGPMAPEAARSLFLGLADALSYAHRNFGISHRDLKPQNVMVRPDGSGCVIDFGIAVDEHSPRYTQEDVLPGTIAYLPPEVFHGGVAPDPQLADVYALGQLLYEVLVGRLAFPTPAGMTAKQASARVIAEKAQQHLLDPGPGVPEALRQVVLGATDPDPRLRFSSVARMAAALGGAPNRGALPGAASRHASAVSTAFEPDDDDDASIELPPGIHLAPHQLSAGAAAKVARPAGPPLFVPPVGPPPVASAEPPPFEPHPLDAGGVVEPRRRRKAVVPPIDLGEPEPAPGGAAGEVVTTHAPDSARRLRRLVLWGLVAGGLASLAVLLLVLAWWMLPRANERAPEEVVTAPGVGSVEVTLTGEGALWWDGAELPVRGGVATLPTVEPGAHTLLVAAGAGCAGQPPAQSACCAVLSQAVEVSAGAPVQLALVAPVAPAPMASLVARVSGKAQGAVALSAGGRSLRSVGKQWRLEGVAPGPLDLRLDVGSCGPEAAGCSAAETCPPGCGSVVQRVEVPCEGEAAVELVAPSPAPAAAPSPTPGKTSPRRRTAPEDDDVIVGGPPPPPDPTVTLQVTTTKGPVTQDVLRAAVLAQMGSISACYDRFLSKVGGTDQYREVVYSFKLKRTGGVEAESLQRLQRSGESAIDECVSQALQRVQVDGSKKTGEGSVKATFRAE
jgi:hypothetical protein